MTTLKNLVLALVNATLILVAGCLVLVLLISQSAERAADRFSEAIGTLAPVRSEISDVSRALQDLRTDLQTLAQQPGALSENSQTLLNVRVDALTTRLTAIDDRLAALSDVPEQTMTTAIDYAADRVSDVVNEYRSCTADAGTS